MGKASRRKREARQAIDKPRWAGADGFDTAWRLAERDIHTHVLLCAPDLPTQAQGGLAFTEFRLDLAHREIETAGAILAHLGETREAETREARAPQDTADMLPPTDAVLRERLMTYRPEAGGLATLAKGHRDALRHAMPILYDPLTSPALDASAVTGLRLPFPVVTCDFLNARGMSMPVSTMEGATKWVGLIAATFVQQTDDIIDVWPVVTTLAEGSTHSPKPVLYGCVRFGGQLPDPPEGLRAGTIRNASFWAIGAETETQLFPDLWIFQPTIAAASALRLLEAVNVTLQPAVLSRTIMRRAGREDAAIPLEVLIRTTRAATNQSPTAGTVDWQHRWTVRGHWMHFKRGPVYNANPRKRVLDSTHGECVKVWCPPFVKGPEGKPLVLKARRLDQTNGGRAPAEAQAAQELAAKLEAKA
jgi:hypothetical protein